MEFLKQWTQCVCLTLIGAAGLSFLSPHGKMKGFYNTVIALFVFISFLLPFKDFNPSRLSCL
ncbi:MAG: hypothetical protein K6C14_06555 [Eubacterium sp.]|nr:hypothetical protein [Eubacterium sp.]